jgi:hypothetical protein
VRREPIVERVIDQKLNIVRENGTAPGVARQAG